MFNFSLGSFCQADLVINMDVPSQLRHIIRGERMEDKGQKLTPFRNVPLHALLSGSEILIPSDKNMLSSILLRPWPREKMSSMKLRPAQLPPTPRAPVSAEFSA